MVKGTVADAFSQLGVPVVDADVIARQVVAVGAPALQKIAAHFGSEDIAG
ncbi:Dephospho-CoA kinase [Hafnia alvei]|uniref:Dephospho-CoA kinase n=1 Tax=Hafnia alvei TaxID=569 RepID=A0A377PN30_HAFAL|nr:Dephospho-CoA kinase [Hafnia alvei]